METTVKNFNDAEKSWTFLDGSKRSIVILESIIIGRGEYLPGWRWSLHAGAKTGKDSAAHVGYVISGSMVVHGPDGKEITVGPGEAFEVGPRHDAWVLGNQPCVALDFESVKQKI